MILLDVNKVGAAIILAFTASVSGAACVTLKDIEESQSKHSRRAAEDMDRFAAAIKDELRAIKVALDGALREARVDSGVAIKAQSEEFANITATLRAILKELQQPRAGRKLSKNVGDLKVTRVSANRFRVSRKQIEETGVDVDRLVSNIEAESIVLNGGRQAGLKILRNDTFGEKIGIKAGDVLQRVNGIPVASVEEAHKIAPSLRKTANVRLDLLRNGAPVQIHILVEK
jgi:C-terminal processing protease CtpA/Prc